MSFCTRCGHRNQDDLRFCVACGNPIARIAATDPPSAGQQRSHANEATSRLNRLFAGALIGILVIAAIGGGAYWLLTARSAADPRASAGANDVTAASSSAGGGFFGKLKTLLPGFSANPIIGKWQADMMGVRLIGFEFGTDTMRSELGTVKVRYDIREREVIVYPEGQSAGLVARLVDQNVIIFDHGAVKLELKRID